MNENFFPFVNSLEYYEYLYSGTDLSFCDWKPNKEQKERIKRLKEKHRQFYADKRPNTRHKEGYISPKDRIDSYIAIFVKNNAEIMEQLKNKVKCIDVAQDYGIPLCSFKKILFELHPNFKFNRKKLTDEQEKMIVKMYYEDRMLERDIASDFGISNTTVSLLIKRYAI